MPTTPTSDDYARVYDAAAVVVLVIATALLLLTWRDYGISWDEGVHSHYGEHIYQYFETRGEDDTALSYRIDYLYGGSFDFLGAAFGRLVEPPLGHWDALHLFGALIGPLGLWGTWQLGRTLGGPRSGLLAALFIAGTSVYWGHMVNNPKDMPFAVGYVWAMNYLVKAIRQFPSIDRRVGIWLAVTMGMAMSVRIAGLLVMCYFVGAIVVWLGFQAWQRRSLEDGYRYARRLGARAAAIAAGAWIVMIVWWPWALHDPLRRPLIALTRMSKFMAHKRKMPFAGEWIWNYDVDWRYMPHYFGLKLPEFIVILGVLGFVLGVVVLIVRARRFRVFTDNLVLGTMLVSLVFPWIYAIYKDSVFYDGLRHFLFEVPVIVACVAWLVSTFIGVLRERWGRWGRWGSWATAVLVGLLCVDQYATMVRYHPFQVVYFNRFIGGLEGAVGKYSTDYYATTYGQAGAKLAEYLWETEPDVFLNTEYTVNGCAGPTMMVQRAPPNFSHKPKLADFWLSYTRKKCDKKHRESPIIFEIERDGGRLNRVRDVREWRDGYLERKAERRARKAKERREQNRKRREQAKRERAEADQDQGEGTDAGETADGGPVIEPIPGRVTKPKHNKPTSRPRPQHEVDP